MLRTDTPLSAPELGLPPRCVKALAEDGKRVWGDISHAGKSELLRLPDMGHKAYNLIKSLQDEHNTYTFHLTPFHQKWIEDHRILFDALVWGQAYIVPKKEVR